jgi:hypothetical protein
MENLDIIILTAVLSTLFIVFGIWTYRELSSFDEKTHNSVKNSNGGPRVNLMKFMQKLFDEDITVKEKRVVYKVVKRTISDMESDGVYFSRDIKDKLKEYRDDLKCEYSGLSSVRAYDDEDFHSGHS